MTTPTPTPTPAPNTYDYYLNKYMQQMGVTASPTPTPAPSGGVAPSGGGMAAPGGGIAAPLIGYKIGSAMFGGAPVGATASPGMIAPTFAAPTTELGALPMMAPTGEVAAASGAAQAGAAAAAATEAGAVPTGLLTGANPALYFGAPLAGLAAFSAAAPVVSPKIRDFVSNTFFGGKDPRDFIPQEVADSKIINNQLPGFSDLPNEKRLEIAQKLNELGILGLPGAKSKYIPGHLQYDPTVRLSSASTRRFSPDSDGLTQMQRGAMQRTTPLTELISPSAWARNSKLVALENALKGASTPQVNRPATAESLDPAIISRLKDMFKAGEL